MKKLIENGAKDIVFFDTETTGIAWYGKERFISTIIPKREQALIKKTALDPDRILEIAALNFDKKGNADFIEELCLPPVPVHPKAADTHGYQQEMLTDKPAFNQLKQAKLFPKWNKAGKYLVAHNVEFDLRMLSYEGLDWDRTKVIDTLAVVRHIYGLEEVEAHTLQYFRMLLKFDAKPWWKTAMAKLELTEIKPHTALSDVFVLWVLYLFLKKEHGLTDEDMVAMTSMPSKEDAIAFGDKFPKGMPYAEVAATPYQNNKKMGWEYLVWAANNMGMAHPRELAIKSALAEYFVSSNNKSNAEFIQYGILYTLETKEEIFKAEKLLGGLGKDGEKAITLYDRAEIAIQAKIDKATEPLLRTQEEDDQVAKARKMLALLRSRREFIYSL